MEPSFLSTFLSSSWAPWSVILLARATQQRHGTFIPVYFPIIQLGALNCVSTGPSDATETWNLHSCLLSYHPVGRPGVYFYWPERHKGDMEPSFLSTFLSSSWAPWSVILLARATQGRHGTFIPVYFPIMRPGV